MAAIDHILKGFGQQLRDDLHQRYGSTEYLGQLDTVLTKSNDDGDRLLPILSQFFAFTGRDHSCQFYQRIANVTAKPGDDYGDAPKPIIQYDINTVALVGNVELTTRDFVERFLTNVMRWYTPPRPIVEKLKSQGLSLSRFAVDIRECYVDALQALATEISNLDTAYGRDGYDVQSLNFARCSWAITFQLCTYEC
jgi:hypothetical protein